MAKLVITRTTPVYAPLSRSGVFVQWDITREPEGSSLGGSLAMALGGAPIRFTVSRSGAPRGPWKTVATGLVQPYFFDAHVPSTSGSLEAWEQRSIAESVYYRVQAFDYDAPNPTTAALAEAVSVVGDDLPRPIALRRRVYQRDFALSLKVGSGILFAIAKLRRWGPRCPRCYDPLTKSVLDNDCPICFSTGMEGGYYEPIIVRARKGVTAVRTSLQPTGTTDVNSMPFWMLDYPLLSKDDLLVELHSDRRYEVDAVARTELRGVPVHQRADISELARDNTGYTFPIPRGTAPTFGP